MENINIKRILPEYQGYVAKATDGNNDIDWDKLVDLLYIDGDWTREGAETLAELVQNYGSFILKNALALAVITNTKDGKFGL